MWTYQKRLQYPVDIKKPDAKLAKVILSQFGGPDGELGASQRYLSQRYSMPYPEVAATLTDIGTEELAHMEIVSSIVRQLLRGLSAEEIQNQGFADYYVDHTAGIWPQAASGEPWSATTFQSKGDPITDLFEDMGAEQKARTTYDNLLRLIRDPDVRDPIKFLRAREITHFQRFGETEQSIWNEYSGVADKPLEVKGIKYFHFVINGQPRLCKSQRRGYLITTSLIVNNSRNNYHYMIQCNRGV